MVLSGMSFLSRRIWLILFFAVLLAIIMLAGAGAKAYADDYDDVRERYKIRITGYDPGDPYNPGDPNISKYIANLDTIVDQYWSTMNGSYTWDDLQTSSATIPADMNRIVSRLKKMAQGWATYGSAHYGDNGLLTAIKNGLEWFYDNRYNENITPYGNYWEWEMGAPAELNATVVLLHDELTSTQIEDYMNAVDHFVPTFPDDYWSGYNRAVLLLNRMLWGVLIKDSDEIQLASDEMSIELHGLFGYVEQSDLGPGQVEGGFLADGSFIQHYDYPYTGEYGKHNIQIIAELMWLLVDSPWENTSADRLNVFDFFYKSFDPVMYKMNLLESVKGRTISIYYYSAVDGSMVVNAGLLLSDLSYNPDAAAMKSKLKYQLQNGFLDLYLSKTDIWSIARANEILDDNGIAPSAELIGNYQFYNMDRVVHRRPGWVYDVAMHSKRISNYETNAGVENLKGWYTADGMTYLYQDPRDYSMNYWITVDPHRQPGTTVDRDTSRPAVSSDHKKSPNSWVGGVSLDGVYGAAGMHFTQHDYSNMDVTARKSWFMFDDEVVALGAGIKSTSGRTIETIVENRPLNSAGDNELKVNGTAKSSSTGWSETMAGTNYVYLQGTGGYVFPGGATVKGLREYREGDSFDIDKWFYVAANDQFNSAILNSSWRWVRVDPAKYSLTGTSVDITTQVGTIEGGTNTAKNILLAATPQHDMYIDTKVTFSPSANEQEAGIVFYLNDDNYVKLSRVYTASGLRIKAVNEVNGSATTNLYSDAYGGTVYLKMEKSGTNYSLYASSNGTSWGSPLMTYSNNIGGTDGFNTGLSMGLFAQNGGNGAAAQITASFDYFHIKQVRKFMTLWFDHGVDPAGGSYSYITLPGKTASEVADYYSDQDVAILANTDKVQAVRETTLGITAANFWRPETVDFITSYSPGSSVMVKEEAGQLTVAVSDPTHKQKKISVELKKTGVSIVSKDSSVTVKQLQPTIVLEIDVDGTDGMTNRAVIAYDAAVTPGEPRGKLTAASASSSSNGTGSAAGNATDGSVNTYWLATSSYPQWLKLDLGSAQDVNHVRLLFPDDYDYPRTYTYNIQTSLDDSSYTTVVGSKQSIGSLLNKDYFPTVSARYIKINITASDPTPGYTAGIREVEVYNSELLVNRGFESGTANWSPYWTGETLTQDGTYQHSGSYSIKVADRNYIGSSAAQDVRNALIERGPGRYTLKAWVRTGSGTDAAKPFIYTHDDNGDHWFSTGSYTAVNSGGFTEITATANVSWTGTLDTAKFYLYTQNTSPVTPIIYVDDVSLVRDELLTNPGFEADVVPWSAYWSTETLTWDDTYKHSGDYSLKISDRTYIGSGSAQNIKDMLLLKGQGSYALKAWVRTGSGTDAAKPFIYIKDDAGDHWFSTGSYTSVNSSSFTEISATANVTWTGTLQEAEFHFYTQNTGPVTPVVYIDDASLIKQ